VDVARTRLTVQPHVFVAIAAVGLDLGMTPGEIAVFGMLPLFHDALANAAEGARHASPELQCLPGRVVEYVGPPPRASERATRNQ
jgi:hypothetical protein